MSPNCHFTWHITTRTHLVFSLSPPLLSAMCCLDSMIMTVKDIIKGKDVVLLHEESHLDDQDLHQVEKLCDVCGSTWPLNEDKLTKEIEDLTEAIGRLTEAMIKLTLSDPPESNLCAIKDKGKKSIKSNPFDPAEANPCKEENEDKTSVVVEWRGVPSKNTKDGRLTTWRKSCQCFSVDQILHSGHWRDSLANKRSKESWTT